jgi:hypothetical protein
VCARTKKPVGGRAHRVFVWTTGGCVCILHRISRRAICRLIGPTRSGFSSRAYATCDPWTLKSTSNNLKSDAVRSESQLCVSTGRLAREWAGEWRKTDQLNRVHSGRISRLYVLRHLQSMFAVEKSLKNQMKSAHTVFPDCRPISDEHNMKFE